MLVLGKRTLKGLVNMKFEDEVTMIALTGGPCAGKDTAIVRLTQDLEDKGFEVYVQPEVAAELILSGITPQRLGHMRFQQLIFNESVRKEELRLSAARQSGSRRKKIILCNRGALDGRAYMIRHQFAKMVAESGYTLPQLWSRYKGAFHLVSAANGAERYYTLANNKARKESISEAKKLDELTRNAWNGHPHLRIIGNKRPGGFGAKYRALLREVCMLLGIPEPLEIERWFLVKPRSFTSLPIDKVVVDIEQPYLLSSHPDEELRIRKRGIDGNSVAYLTQKLNRGDVRIEDEMVIYHAEYSAHLLHRDKSRWIVRKKRCCFVWNEQYLELDHFTNPRFPFLKLECELTRSNQEVVIPPFLKVIKEVTGDPAYSNFMLAKK